MRSLQHYWCPGGANRTIAAEESTAHEVSTGAGSLVQHTGPVPGESRSGPGET